MKVLLVNTSPKEKGSTYHVLEYISKEFEARGVESEIFWLGTAVDGGCRGCMACRELGSCAFNRDRVNELCDRAKDSDGFVFASPVHYASASGNFTAGMDRAFYSASKHFAHKPASCVAVARRGGCSAALDQMAKYLTISSMPLVSSTYWNMIHSSKPGDFVRDEEGMQTMRNLCENMTWLLLSIEAGKKAGVKAPEVIKEIRTDFNK